MDGTDKDPMLEGNGQLGEEKRPHHENKVNFILRRTKPAGGHVPGLQLQGTTILEPHPVGLPRDQRLPVFSYLNSGRGVR